MKTSLSLWSKLRKNKKGLTLIELSIGACLIVVVLSLAYSIYLFGIQGYINNTALIEKESNVRIAFERVGYSIRQSNKVKIKDTVVIIGNDDFKFKNEIIYLRNSPLATGISEFSVTNPEPSLICVTISSTPDERGKGFSLQAFYYLRDY